MCHLCSCHLCFAYRSYRSALSALASRVKPKLFLSLLPADGNTAFFAPLVVRALRRCLQPIVRTGVLKEAAELAARPVDSLW